MLGLHLLAEGLHLAGRFLADAFDDAIAFDQQLGLLNNELLQQCHIVRQLIHGERHVSGCNEPSRIAQERVAKNIRKFFYAVWRSTMLIPESNRSSCPLVIWTAVALERGNWNSPRSSRL